MKIQPTRTIIKMCLKYFKYFIFLSVCIHNTLAKVQKLSLDSTSWTVEQKENGYNFPAIVPGGIYTDLMRSEVIGDVFYGFNDTETRWVSKMDWNYSTQFSVDENILKHKTVNLVFEGIDTFSRIFLNGYELGSTENMFVQHIFDIKPYLKTADNNLQVRFRSAVKEATNLFLEQSENYPIVPLCVPNEYNGECHVNHIRKTQASFAWDWGPGLPSMGIWKSVYVEAHDSAIIRDVTVNILNSNDTFWNIQLQIYLSGNEGNTAIDGHVYAVIHTDEGDFAMKSENILIEQNINGDYLSVLTGFIEKSFVKLWWPNGYGDANLYSIDVWYKDMNDEEQSKKTFKIGFRTVELLQDKIESGNLFYFKVNDVPIYAKGTNSIPINILPELAQSEDTIRFLLQSAKDVNMNMIRVWGGGNYEADIFYELADEFGLLIWQDFMFACNMYPATDHFLRNVKQEVRHQVRRLQHHPSIIIWAGNNENEAALRQNWYGTASNFEQFKADYIKLYVETIQPELLISYNTRSFLVSSPSNGVQSILEDYIAMEPQSNYYGDIHFYNYVADSWDTASYPIPRFSSEFGYQSLPSVNTLLTATDDINDLHKTSEFLNKRQHLPQGFFKMDLLLNYRLNLPNEDHKDYYKAYIYNSQILQAMAVKIETEHNRQWRSIFNEDGTGHTMGALYWQLNDVWVAPTWSGMDFKGNWKMMQYFSKHFFAPVIITGHITGNGDLNVYVVSDLTYTITDAIITVHVYRWDSLVPVHNHIIDVDIDSSQSKQVLSVQLENYLGSIDNVPCGLKSMQNCFLYFTVTNNGAVTPNNYVFPTPLKSSNISQADVQIRSITEHQRPNLYFTIEISVNKIALFVWLEAGNIQGRFSDNGFLQVTEITAITFTPVENVSLSELKDALSVVHLMTYRS